MNKLTSYVLMVTFATAMATACVYIAHNYVIADLFDAKQITPQKSLLLGFLFSLWIDLDEKKDKIKKVAKKGASE